MNWKGRGRKRFWLNLIYCPEFIWRDWIKYETPQDSWHADRDSNRAPPNTTHLLDAYVRWHWNSVAERSEIETQVKEVAIVYFNSSNRTKFSNSKIKRQFFSSKIPTIFIVLLNAWWISSPKLCLWRLFLIFMLLCFEHSKWVQGTRSKVLQSCILL
jgi:hypothetical protein